MNWFDSRLRLWISFFLLLFLPLNWLFRNKTGTRSEDFVGLRNICGFLLVKTKTEHVNRIIELTEIIEMDHIVVKLDVATTAEKVRVYLFFGNFAVFFLHGAWLCWEMRSEYWHVVNDIWNYIEPIQKLNARFSFKTTPAVHFTFQNINTHTHSEAHDQPKWLHQIYLHRSHNQYH